MGDVAKEVDRQLGVSIDFDEQFDSGDRRLRDRFGRRKESKNSGDSRVL